MSKNLLQDMVKVRTINKKVIQKEKVSDLDSVEYTKKRPRYGLYFVALASVVFLFFAVSFLFSSAKITLTPKTQSLSLNDKISATKDLSSEGLPFNLIAISGSETKNIQGQIGKSISMKAKGSIIFYNNFSKSPQNFPANTKLEGSNGKIYKTYAKIIVPGITKDGKPGSIEASVYADVAGEEYNSSPLNFKVSMFKGTSKYSKIYALSKGDITGGFKGSSYVISDLNKQSAISELKVALQADLFKKATAQIPLGFILFKDAVFLSIDSENVGVSAGRDGVIPIEVKGTFYGFLFNQSKLTKKIAEDVIDKYDGSDLYIPNMENLIFSLSNKDSVSFTDVENINFTLSGNPKFIWKVDEEKLVSDLLGKSKGDFNQILSTYTNIASADLTITPPWKSSFPDESKDIKVTVNYPK